MLGVIITDRTEQIRGAVEVGQFGGEDTWDFMTVELEEEDKYHRERFNTRGGRGAG